MEIPQDALAETLGAVEHIRALLASDVTIDEHLFAVTIRLPARTGVQGSEIAAQIEPIGEFATSRLHFEADGLEFELTAQPGEGLQLATAPAGDPTRVFVGTALELAQRAWAGDERAAIELTGTWGARVDVDLGRRLNMADRSFTWVVLRSLQPLMDAFQSYPWWRAGELIWSNDGHTIIFVILSAMDLYYATQSFLVASPDRLGEAAMLPGVAARRTAVEAASYLRLAQPIPLPEELVPSTFYRRLGGTREDSCAEGRSLLVGVVGRRTVCRQRRARRVT